MSYLRTIEVSSKYSQVYEDLGFMKLRIYIFQILLLMQLHETTYFYIFSKAIIRSLPKYSSTFFDKIHS